RAVEDRRPRQPAAARAHGGVAHAGRRRAGRGAGGRMKHVIVVEDDPVNATLFRKLLERRGGYRVTVTLTVEQLLERARGDADLVLRDVSLHGATWESQPVSGVELCRMLKADPATAALPVLLATAHAMRGDEEKLLQESGADGYVAKPVVDHERFLEQI